LTFRKNMIESKKAFFFVFFFILMISFSELGQKSKAQLEKEKKENLQKIKDAERILSETSSQKNASLGQLAAITQQVEASEALIKSYSNEVALLDREIAELKTLLQAVETEIANIKKEYAMMI